MNRNLRNGRPGGRGAGFTGQDLPFAGFSFSKNLVDAAQVSCFLKGGEEGGWSA